MEFDLGIQAKEQFAVLALVVAANIALIVGGVYYAVRYCCRQRNRD